MSGFYDCWDLGGLDTTLNSYLASVRTAKTVPPPEVADRVAPPDTFAAAPAPAPAPVPVPTPVPTHTNPYTNTNTNMDTNTNTNTNRAHRSRPQYDKMPGLAGMAGLSSMYNFLSMLLSPAVCLFLWMLLVSAVVILIVNRRSKQNKYLKKYKAAKQHLRKYDRV